MLKLALIAIATNLVSRAAGAHPGHGDPGQGLSLAHYLTEPIHVLGALAVIGLLLASARVLHQRRRAPTP